MRNRKKIKCLFIFNQNTPSHSGSYHKWSPWRVDYVIEHLRPNKGTTLLERLAKLNKNNNPVGAGSIVEKIMLDNERLKFESIRPKWYVRHDFYPELIPSKWNKDHINYMVNLGNSFCSKEEAVEMCNKIRLLFNAPPIS